MQSHWQHNKCLQPNKINVTVKEVEQMVWYSKWSLYQLISLLTNENSALGINQGVLIENCIP